MHPEAIFVLYAHRYKFQRCASRTQTLSGFEVCFNTRLLKLEEFWHIPKDTPRDFFFDTIQIPEDMQLRITFNTLSKENLQFIYATFRGVNASYPQYSYCNGIKKIQLSILPWDVFQVQLFCSYDLTQGDTQKTRRNYLCLPKQPHLQFAVYLQTDCNCPSRSQ